MIRGLLRPHLSEGPHGVVLVSDGGARTARSPWYVAFARLDDAVVAQVQPEAVARFRQAAEGTRDSQQGDKNSSVETDGPQRPIPVTRDGQDEIIGYRQPGTDELYPGRVLWGRVDTSGGESVITELKVAQVWRALGQRPLEQRVPSAVLPCESASRLRVALGLDAADTESWNVPEMRELCPSCSLFGSAVEGDVDLSKPRRKGRQPRDERRGRGGGYRGRVRVASARLVDARGRPVRPVEKDLAPMGSPHPGAGQFYLDNTGWEGMSAERGKMPLARWSDDQADAGEPRHIRGRKFYWRTEVNLDAENARSAPVDADAAVDSMAASQRGARIVDAGALLTVTLFVDDVTSAEVGGLLASVAPGLVLGDGSNPGDHVLSIGGGKPFGFGSAAVRSEAGARSVRFALTTARARYLGEAGETQPTVTDAVAAFEATIDRIDAAPRRNALAAMTRIGGVPDTSVRYPNDARGTAPEPAPGRGPESDHEFWQFTAGQYSTVGSTYVGIPVQVPSELRSLPMAAADDVAMPTADELREQAQE